MNEKNRLPIWLAALITVIVIVVVGGIWYTSTMNIKKQEKRDASNSVDIGTVALETTGEEATVESEGMETVPGDDEFEFVDLDKYESEIRQLDELVNCQYRNNYNWDGILRKTQSDYIIFQLGSMMTNTNNKIDVTPSMKSIIKQMEDTIFNESILYFESSLSSEDLCEEPLEGETVEYAPTDTSIDSLQLTYPTLYYECMLDSNGKLANSLDESILINAILLDNPRLEYLEDKWFLTKVDNESEYRLLNHVIEVKDVYSQMEGLDEFKFSYDTLRVCGDYLILGIYRGDVYFNLRLRKDEGYYEILNIDQFLEALVQMPL